MIGILNLSQPLLTSILLLISAAKAAHVCIAAFTAEVIDSYQLFCSVAIMVNTDPLAVVLHLWEG